MDRNTLKEEIIRCGKDPSYFINKYVRIQHPKRGMIPFKMFDYQEDLVKDYQENRFNVILKGRQLGISEVTAAYALWLMMFHRNKNILVMASKAETAKNIIKKVKYAIRKLPEWLVIAEITIDNRLSVELANGSQIKAIATSADAGRSEALSLLIVDEAAFVPNFDEIWTGLYPTVAAGGSAIVLSTPCGVGNKFHELCVGAEQEENEFKYTKLMWWRHPERISDLEDDPERPGFKTSSWFRKEVKSAKMSPREVAQELECNFNASGDTFLTTEQISWVEEGTVTPNIMKHWDRNLHVWWEPERNKRYMISCDVARGDGKDHSAAIVWDVDRMEECAEYYGKLSPEEFAHLIVDLGHEYNTAMLVVENANIGMACLEHVRLAGYENVYYSVKGDAKPGQSVHSAWGPPSQDMVIGFTMSMKSRPLVLAKLEEFARNRAVYMRSKRIHNELVTFIWENGKPQAMKGYNDDLTMAAAIGCWIKDTVISPGEMAANLQGTLLSNMKVFGHVNTQIVGASKNPEHVPHAQMGVFTTSNSNPFRISMPGNRSVDISWLWKK